MQYIFIISFIWLGMVVAISFFEAPLKFRAKGITRANGLSIGRLIFYTFNKIEIVFYLINLIPIFYFRITTISILIAFLTLILSLQTFLLLPILEQRAISIINGVEPKGASPHIYYIVLEICKVITLLVLGIKQVELYKLNSYE